MVSIKKLTVIAVVFAMIGVASAGFGNKLVNGNIENGSNGWEAGWGTNEIPIDDPIEVGNHAAGVWHYDGGIFQDVELGAGDYEFGGRILNIDTGGNDPVLAGGRRAVIRAEVGPAAAPHWYQEVWIDETATPGVWQFGEGDPIITIGEGDTFNVRILMMLVRETDELGNVLRDGAGNGRFDDLYLGLPGYLERARDPQPADTIEVGVDYIATTDLSWTNPDPNTASDTITSTVWFKVDDGDPNFYVANGDQLDSGLVDIETTGVVLANQTTYAWRVDSTNSSTGITTEGEIWYFVTGDAPPVPDAGADQYVWLTGGSVTINLNGSVVDDGDTPLVTEWVYNDTVSETDPATIVLGLPTNSLTAIVTIDNTGWFQFQLNADDDNNHAEDTVRVGVYVDACTAAKEDPNDELLVGDFDEDCDVDISDFAMFAETFLGCMSAKLGCTPL